MESFKPGSRWRSTVCSTEIAIVRPPNRTIELSCGGRNMISLSAARLADESIVAEFSLGTQLGKRYADVDSGLEVLCTKGGVGTLSVEGRMLTQKEAKRLPSSD